MTDDGLEARVALDILWLPHFDGSVCAAANQHVETLDVRVEHAADLSLVPLGRLECDQLGILAAVDEELLIDCLALEEADLARGEPHKDKLVLVGVSVRRQVDIL